MDMPIALGLSVTYGYSLYVTLNRSGGEVYFDTVTNLIVILIGRYLEGSFVTTAVSATSLYRVSRSSCATDRNR